MLPAVFRCFFHTVLLRALASFARFDFATIFASRATPMAAADAIKRRHNTFVATPPMIFRCRRLRHATDAPSPMLMLPRFRQFIYAAFAAALMLFHAFDFACQHDAEGSSPTPMRCLARAFIFASFRFATPFSATPFSPLFMLLRRV